MFFQDNAGLIASGAAQICKTLRDNLFQAQGFQNWLTDQTDAELTGIGFTEDQITTLRAAFADLAALGGLVYGQAVPTSYGITGTYDFSKNIKQVSGVV
jgi:hypothetical protein